MPRVDVALRHAPAPRVLVEDVVAAGLQEQPAVLADQHVRLVATQQPANRRAQGHRRPPLRRTVHSPPTRTASRAMFSGWRYWRDALRKSRNAARSRYGSRSMYMP